MISNIIHRQKYAATKDETWEQTCERVCTAVGADGETLAAMISKEFIPGGRMLANLGTGRDTTAFNCFVGPTIHDSMEGIFDTLKVAALTQQMGGGIGHDFSPLRPGADPKNGILPAVVRGVGAEASGPLTFMDTWDSMCRTIMSAGSRRGAMMATLRCDHPNIEAFIEAKGSSELFELVQDPSVKSELYQKHGRLRMFNVSVLITDAFMDAVRNDKDWHLVHNVPPVSGSGERVPDGNYVYKTMKARDLWDKIMRHTYEFSEPGVIFIDRVNEQNNLKYCEEISATNPSLAAGTRVHTNLGLLPIEELQGKTFKIRNRLGFWVDAECWLSDPEAEVVELDFGGGRKTVCTPQHKWPVRMKDGEHVRTRTSELKVGDLIPVNVQDDLEFNVDESLTAADGHLLALIFCYGQFQGDDTLHFHVPYSNRAFARNVRIAEYISELVNTEVVDHRKAGKTITVVGERVQELRHKFQIGDLWWSETLYRSNDAYVKGFIGMLFGTSHLAQSRLHSQFTHPNFDFLAELCKLLSFYGVSSRVTSKELYFNASQINKVWGFFRTFDPARQERNLLARPLKMTPPAGNTHVKVEGITVLETPVPVWDITVHDDLHNFPIQYCETGNCGEQPLPPNGNCCLVTINLAKCVHRPFTDSAWADETKIRKLAAMAVRYANSVIDIAKYPTEAMREESLNKRRIGVGVMGLGTLLQMMQVRYGSNDSLRVVSDVMSASANGAYQQSSQLARVKGTFPLYDHQRWRKSPIFNKLDPSVRQDINNRGMRNGVLLNIAPTGTTALLADNVSSGIEPPFYWEANRKVLQADLTHLQYTIQDYGYAMYRELNPTGPLPDYFVTATDITPHEQIAVQAAAQQWVDASISKTVSCPEGMTFEEFKDVYQTAYDSGCKGCTTYVPSIVRGSVVSAAPDKEKTVLKPEDHEAFFSALDAPPKATVKEKRPFALDSRTYKMDWPFDDAATYVTVSEEGGKMKEVFVSSKFLPHYEWITALTRLISAMMRAGIDPKFLINELLQIHDHGAGGRVNINGKSTWLASRPAALAAILEYHMNGREDDVHVDVAPKSATVTASRSYCPACGAPAFVRSAGCWSCQECGHEQCQ